MRVEGAATSTHRISRIWDIAGDDRLQQHVRLVVGGRTHLDRGWRAIGIEPVHVIQRQSVQTSIEVGRGSEARDQRKGTAVAFVPFSEGYASSSTKNHTIDLPATRQVRDHFANPVAVQAALNGKPLPDGAVLFAEV